MSEKEPTLTEVMEEITKINERLDNLLTTGFGENKNKSLNQMLMEGFGNFMTRNDMRKEEIYCTNLVINEIASKVGRKDEVVDIRNEIVANITPKARELLKRLEEQDLPPLNR